MRRRDAAGSICYAQIAVACSALILHKTRTFDAITGKASLAYRRTPLCVAASRYRPGCHLQRCQSPEDSRRGPVQPIWATGGPAAAVVEWRFTNCCCCWAPAVPLLRILTVAAARTGRSRLRTTVPTRSGAMPTVRLKVGHLLHIPAAHVMGRRERYGRMRGRSF
jgi:hypothetical protein